jgi:arabinofuranosyltransferase
MSDDAYITLRTVDNFVHGYGLTWNVGERVQAFTHPLWMLVLSSIYYFTREPYYTTIFLSMLISLIAVTLVVFLASRTVTGAFLSIITLVLAKSFVDYSTSGLENPLTHLILVVFLTLFFRYEPSSRNLFRLSLVASLGMVNRMDAALILAPPLLYVFLQKPNWRSFWVLALGQLPFLVWEGFSLLYYGFPFPNTAYAKMTIADWSRWTFVKQGVFYLLNAVDFDPLTVTIVVGGLAFPFITKRWRSLPVAFGIMLHLAYIIYIGGDFMSGRLLTAALVGAVIIITQFDFEQMRPIGVAAILAAVVALGYSTLGSTLTSNSEFSYDMQQALELHDQHKVEERDRFLLREMEARIDHRGVTDERGFYYPHTGLLMRSRTNHVPLYHWWDIHGRKLHTDLYVVVTVGFVGYYAGPAVHVVDRVALGDPLLARIPPFRTTDWGAGHLERVIPEGYLETLRSGENRIADPDLAAYYDRLALIIKADLWSGERLKAIWEMNTGKYDHLIDFNRYRYPGMVHVEQASLSSNPEQPSKVPFGDSGVQITLNADTHASMVEVGLEPNNDYQAFYLQDGVRLAEQAFAAYHADLEFWTYVLQVPSRAAEGGYNQVWILPLSRRGETYVGHFRLIE